MLAQFDAFAVPTRTKLLQVKWLAAEQAFGIERISDERLLLIACSRLLRVVMLAIEEDGETVEDEIADLHMLNLSCKCPQVRATLVLLSALYRVLLQSFPAQLVCTPTCTLQQAEKVQSIYI